MPKPEATIRRSQLLTTFGPGAMLDLPRHAVLIGGLEFWSQGGEIVQEPRLTAKLARLLQIDRLVLKSPPAAVDQPGAPITGISVFEFPEWFIVQNDILGAHGARARRLVHKSALTNGKFLDDGRQSVPVVPVRFVRACRAGHIGDIDWYAFTHGAGDTCRRALRLEERGTSGDLTEMWVVCDCGKERSIREAAQMENVALGHCDGARPWLGLHARENCHEINRLLVRSASNAYFPQLMTAISLPERNAKVRQAVDVAWPFLETAESLEDVRRERKKSAVREKLEDIADEEVWEELLARQHGGSAEKSVKEAELETLIRAQESWGEDRPEGVFFARALPENDWRQPGMEPVKRVVLVHRLREVVAQAGFTRFEPVGTDIEGELDLGARRAALSREITWLPAYENRGEGIFLQFDDAAIAAWLGRQPVQARGKLLERGFHAWKREHHSQLDFPGLVYILLHSISHLLMTAIALKCGYPSSALRERIYALPSLGYGVLLYTGGPDSEGTLGGLVEVGRQIHDAMDRALRYGSLCSNDPVCAQHDPSGAPGRLFLQGAACHGCLLIAETSCELHNDFLDRALVVPTIADRDAALCALPSLP